MAARTGPLPVQAMQTFAVDTPPATHWRPATCAEVGCGQYQHGWVTRLAATDHRRIHLVRTSGRRPRTVVHEAGEIVFTFEPGTPCFSAAAHRVRLDRPELYVVRAGTPRQILGTIREHTRPELFVEDMHEQTDAAIQRL